MPRQTTAHLDHPNAVLEQIAQLAQNIAIARKRRGESQAQWAKKLGISQPTMGRIERGDPAVAMASYVMCMWLINQAEGLADLIAPAKDHAALEKEVAKVRGKRKPGQPFSSQSMHPSQILPADRPSPKAAIPNPPALARVGADPRADIRKSLGSAGKASATAKGLAALMAKPVSKKND